MAARTARRGGSSTDGLLSIGALSAATGIPIDTIRTWERRYGFPVAERKPSGHRVYGVQTAPRLRRIAEAIARGHRAAEVVPHLPRLLQQVAPLLKLVRLQTEKARATAEGGPHDDVQAVPR